MVVELNRLLKSGLRRRVSALKRNLLRRKEFDASPRLMFVFLGGNRPWPEQAGRELYRTEAVFRETFEQCDQVVRECLGFSPSELLTGTARQTASGEDEAERQRIIMGFVFELALSNLWREYAVEPEAVSGLCIGEVAAAYTAGALSLEESAAVACSISRLVTHRALTGRFLKISADLDTMTNLGRASLAPLDLCVEFSPATTLAYCAESDLDEIKRFLAKNEISYHHYPTAWAHHTTRVIDPKELADGLYQPQPRPLRLPLYSTLTGDLIAPGTVLDSSYWYTAVTSFVWCGRTICAALSDGYNVALNLSPFTTLETAIKESAGNVKKEVLVLGSISKGDEPQHKTWSGSLRSLRARGLVGRAKKNPAREGESLDLLRRDVVRNPYAHYTALRRTGSVHFLPAHGFWLVLDYEDVLGGLKQTHLFSNSPGRNLDSALLGADPPAHTRVRRILNPYYSTHAISRLEDYTRACSAKLLARGREKDEFDLVGDFAVPLTEFVIGHFLGLAEEETKGLRRKLSPYKYQLAALTPILEKWARERVRRAQNSGGGGSDDDRDICRKLMQDEEGKTLTPEEIADVLKLFWVAGTTTTSMLIANSVLLLLQHPQIRKEVRDDFRLIPQFVEESLRLEAPEQTAWRIAQEDTELAGVEIPAGSQVRFCLGAANRDPRHFAEPDRLLLERTPNDHLSFAAGPHYCLGAMLARMEARVALETLLAEWPDFRAARHLYSIEYLESSHFRALKNLHITTPKAFGRFRSETQI
jgi:cytochrome P450